MKKRWLPLIAMLGLLLATPAWAAPQVFTEHIIKADFDEASSVYATDLDGDGDVDVLGTASFAHNITWWENDGSENFTEHTITNIFGGASSVNAIDLDGDGDVDVLGAAWSSDRMAWWENDGSENFTQHTIQSGFDEANSVYATDLDGDGDVDVLGAAHGADDITWWENDPSGKPPPLDPIRWTQHTIAGNFNGADSVYATDLDGDGDVDVLGAAFDAGDIAWWENNGREKFTKHTIVANFHGAISVYATDLDRDSDMDVLGAGFGVRDIAWWENDGSEKFTKHIIAGEFKAAYSVYATDVDGDGDVDVLGAAYYDDQITWWENDGSERFTKHIIARDFNGAGSVYAIDLDGDRDVDVLGAARDADEITWWENMGLANGSFEEDGSIPTPWEGMELGSQDRRVCKCAHGGSCSFKMIGTTANKALGQVVDISGDAGDGFTLSGWSKARDPLPSGGAYCLEAKVLHTDATTKTYKACFTKSTHGWQYKKKDFVTEKGYIKIEVYLRYDNQGGKAWFDEVRLRPH